MTNDSVDHFSLPSILLPCNLPSGRSLGQAVARPHEGHHYVVLAISLTATGTTGSISAKSLAEDT